MTETPRSVAVAEALRAGRWLEEADAVIADGVALLIAAIGASARPLADQEAADAIGLLNRHRRFDQTCRFADAWHARDRFDLRLSKHHVQALIEGGSLDEASRRIADLLAHAERLQGATPEEQAAIDKEKTELRGLTGRVAKDLYVYRRKTHCDSDALSDELLERAQRIYAGEYARDPARYWQGINALALEACRDRTHGQPPAADFGERVRTLAQPLLARVEAHAAQRGKLDRIAGGTLEQRAAAAQDEAAWKAADGEQPWILATLSEAYLALGNCNEAMYWLRRATAHAQFGPFNLASYARQLREIWDGDALRPDHNCAGRLAAHLLEHERTVQGTVTLSTRQLDDLRVINTPFEKRFSDATGFDFLKIAAACDSIGRVCSLTGTHQGSGFLLKRRLLWPDGPDDLVFVTNAHVISPDDPRAALRPENACVLFSMESFTTQAPARFHRVRRVLFTSSWAPMSTLMDNCTKLDITIAELESLPPKARGLTINLELPDLKQPAYVIGYPGASDITLSTNDSTLIDKDTLPRLFHYRTPTDYGSSGSPVFNKDWEVIGVHHAGNFNTPRLSGPGMHNANEGIALWALSRRLATQLAGVAGRTGGPGAAAAEERAGRAFPAASAEASTLRGDSREAP